MGTSNAKSWLHTRWPARLGGFAAVLGGIHWIGIVIAFTIHPWGAAGDRIFGNYYPFLFLGSLSFTIGLAGLYFQYRTQFRRIWGLAMCAAILGSGLVTLGNFGGFWLDFPRSGNYISFPGHILLRIGLILFGSAALKRGLSPAWSSSLPLAIGVAPLVLVAARGLDIFFGVPMLSESALVSIGHFVIGGLWFLVGVSLLTAPEQSVAARRTRRG